MSENKDLEENETPLKEDSKDILWNIEEAKDETKVEEKSQNEDKIIFDININSIDDLIDILQKNQYDFLVIEPQESYVKISFKKDSILKLQKYIKYPTYSSLLISSKRITNLDLEKTKEEQKWTWNYEFNKVSIELIAKTVPTNFWENIFLKINEIKKIEKKEVKKKNIDVKMAFSFLASVLFVALVVWGWFLSFIVFNAKTVEDVSFFYNLWINLNQINHFLLVSTTIIFSALIFILTVALIIFLFKALLTKKEQKRKKRVATIVSILIFLITFGTWTVWMSVDKAIRALPNWQEMSYWNIQLYDNDLLTNKNFTKDQALISDYTNIIWPITIKFDLSYYQKEELRKWFQVKKYIWDFWWTEKLETLSPELIKEFKDKWTYNLKISVEWTDRSWQFIAKEINDAPKINIWYTVWVSEKALNNWWKTIELDATDLKVLWDIEWYLEDDLQKAAYIWEIFRPSKIYFEKEIIWMQIKNKFNNWKTINKVFVISWSEANIEWDIDAKVSLDDDLEYTLAAKNIENNFWDWFIENFKWIIEWEEFDKKADITNLEDSSKITHKFETYWSQTIKLIMTNSSWNSKEISKVINIPKNINLDRNVQILNWDEELTDYKYDKQTKEYFIYNIWIPTKLKFDATTIRPDSPLYTISDIEWNISQNWNKFLKNWKSIDYDIQVEWDVEIEVKYKLEHRKNKDDIIEKIEKIYIEPTKKEVQLNLQISSDSDYVPAIVSFDASLSQIKWENIVKFIYDYWDWTTPEERDAKNYWRKYLKEWTYDVKLTVVTESWKEYSTTKKLVLKPKPQNISIQTSLLNAPVWQEIDFLSTWSQWQIMSYHWSFWDWNFSNEANPSHAYDAPWKYTVKLTLDFANNNILSDDIEIEITK